MTHRLISIVLLVLFSSIAVHNAFEVVNYTINYEKIKEELCENKNTEITQCNGLCYLSEQIAEPTPLNNAFDINDIRVNLSFLFYFFEAPAVEKPVSTSQDQLAFIKQNILFDQYIADIPVPPPSVM